MLIFSTTTTTPTYKCFYPCKQIEGPIAFFLSHFVLDLVALNADIACVLTSTHTHSCCCFAITFNIAIQFIKSTRIVFDDILLLSHRFSNNYYFIGCTLAFCSNIYLYTSLFFAVLIDRNCAYLTSVVRCVYGVHS